MGLERRGNRTYYYRKRRRGGRVVSEYIGSGADAALMAHLIESDRGIRESRAWDWKREVGRLEAAERALRDYCEGVEALARAALVVAGYHRHHRGEWRKRRVKRDDADRARGEAPHDGQGDQRPAEAGGEGR